MRLFIIVLSIGTINMASAKTDLEYNASTHLFSTSMSNADGDEFTPTVNGASLHLSAGKREKAWKAEVGLGMHFSDHEESAKGSATAGIFYVDEYTEYGIVHEEFFDGANKGTFFQVRKSGLTAKSRAFARADEPRFGVSAKFGEINSDAFGKESYGGAGAFYNF